MSSEPDVDVSGPGWTLSPSRRESARFGIGMARLTIHDGGLVDETMSRAVAEHPAPVIVARYPSEATCVPALLVAAQRQVLPAGALVYWEEPKHSIHPAAAPLPPHVQIEETSAGSRHQWETTIRDLVEDTFDGYLNHYSYNPLLSADLTTAGYVEWATTTALEPSSCALVLRVDGEPAALATACPDPDGLDILLAGVRRPFQGRGLYPLVLAAVQGWARDHYHDRVVISTQASNVRVQRSWVRSGWRPYRTVETVHLVSRTLG